METKIICEECKKEFGYIKNKPKDPRRRFCQECSAVRKERSVALSRYNRIMHKDRRCKICGVDISGCIGKTRFCQECKSKATSLIVGNPNPLSHLAAVKRYNESNAYKVAVKAIMKSHWQLLTIIYECSCEDVGKEYHHFDYSRPLHVLKLCDFCHKKEHSRFRKLEKEAKRMSLFESAGIPEIDTVIIRGCVAAP